MIKYLFTNNKLIGSKLISMASKTSHQTVNETPSHFAILFNDRWVLHSNFADGVNIEPFYYFKQKNNIVSSLKEHCDHKTDIECTLFFDQLVRKSYGSSYDFPAIIYFSWRLALKWLFNRPIPVKNRLQVQDKWFCNELFETVSDEELSMKTPNDLMWMMIENPEYISCETFS